MVLPPAFLGTLHEQEPNMAYRLQLICEDKVVADTADARPGRQFHPVVGQTVNWECGLSKFLTVRRGVPGPCGAAGLLITHGSTV